MVFDIKLLFLAPILSLVLSNPSSFAVYVVHSTRQRCPFVCRPKQVEVVAIRPLVSQEVLVEAVHCQTGSGKGGNNTITSCAYHKQSIRLVVIQRRSLEERTMLQPSAQQSSGPALLDALTSHGTLPREPPRRSRSPARFNIAQTSTDEALPQWLLPPPRLTSGPPLFQRNF